MRCVGLTPPVQPVRVTGAGNQTSHTAPFQFFHIPSFKTSLTSRQHARSAIRVSPNVRLVISYASATQLVEFAPAVSSKQTVLLLQLDTASPMTVSC